MTQRTELKPKILIKESFRAYMEMRSWGVQDLADAVKLSKQQVSPILNRKAEPSKNFMHRISAVTGMGIEDIFETVFV